GTLPPNMPFTAHPKFDPATGVGYAYGVRRGPGLPLTVYRMELNGKLTQLYALPQKTYPIIHDMLLAKDHIIFVIPPVNVDFMAATKGKIPAEILLYAEKEPTRLVVLRKDGTGQPVTIEQPPGFVFHHGNAFDRDGKIVIDSFLSSDASVLELIYSFGKDSLPATSPVKFTRLTIDPVKGVVESRTEFGVNEEFPRFDERRAGQDVRFLYTLETNRGDDSFAFSALIRHDLHNKISKRIVAGKGRAVGEAVFVPHPGKDSEERGWLLQQGYDAGRDENYLDIRDAQTLDLAARIWTGIHFPLGFHGNFSTRNFITI
ncbi:MAG TPA: carotenoid oxygenase family protein, partial [Blastocatellia bacterium]|nr:carotenoid oxygenase family protein [Blastocatellia bacterium]